MTRWQKVREQLGEQEGPLGGAGSSEGKQVDEAKKKPVRETQGEENPSTPGEKRRIDASKRGGVIWPREEPAKRRKE